MKRQLVQKSSIITQRELEHLSKVREIAAEGMVLLKNDGVLPLANIKKVALFGNGARKTIKGGIGSGDVNCRQAVTVEQGLINIGCDILTTSWLDAYDKTAQLAQQNYVDTIMEKAKLQNKHPVLLFLAEPYLEPEYQITDSVDFANLGTDTAIYVLARNSGEGRDRVIACDYLLTETEQKDIALISSKFNNFILILNVGGVIELNSVISNENVNAIILMSQAGSAGGDAVCDILSAKITPSGKLSTTWAKNYADYPEASNFSHIGKNLNDSYYKEGIYVGYRYFDSFNITPAFEFGYGLSYTKFSISVQSVTLKDNIITVKACAKNIGKYNGKEVLQVYYSAPSGKIDKPYQELAGFAKTKTLAPNQQENICISFNVEDMASYCESLASYILEKGIYYIRVGTSSRDTKIVSAISIGTDIKTLVLKNIFAPPSFKDIKPNCLPCTYPSEVVEKQTVKAIKLNTAKTITQSVDYSNIKQEIDQSDISEKITLKMVQDGRYSINQLVSQLTPLELASLCCGAYNGEQEFQIIGNSSISVPGSAGETTSLLYKERGISPVIMADGPAGLRLLPTYYVDKDENFLYSDQSAIIGVDATMGGKKEKPDLSNAEMRYQYATAIPIATSLAQTWNSDCLYDAGKLIGDEMKGFGINLWLAPGMNIHRNPLCGRNFEYYSEDPVLSGKCAAFITKGVQLHSSTGTTIKHFACNNQENNRNFNNSHVSERALREIYLKGFEIAIKESNPLSIMTSYNLLNGEHTANSFALVDVVLQQEWRYNGLIMTDWGTTGNGGFNDTQAGYPTSNPGGCVKAGNDIIMPGSKQDIDNILNSLNNPNATYPINLADLQHCAKKVILTALKTL